MRLYTQTFGSPSGPPLLALHGVRNHGGRYRRLADDALGDARVVAPDLRGHGRSGWEPPWNVETHVADVLETLDALGITDPVEVIGHSFGGLIACALARQAPTRVRALILLDPAAGLDPEACVAAATADVRGEGRAASWASVEHARTAWAAMRPPEGMWAMDEDLAAFLVRCADGRYRLRFSRPAAVTAWSEMARPVGGLGAWRGPVTLVTARREPFVTVALRARLRGDCGALLHEVDVDSGHIMMWDAPEQTAAVVRAARARTGA